MDSHERGMNPVTMTIINPRKEYWLGQGIKPATSCSQVLYATNKLVGAQPFWKYTNDLFNPLPDDKILDWSKLKQIVDDIF